MRDKTRQQYLSIAEHFLKTRFPGDTATPRKIQQALIECASDYRPDYWRRLRKALEIHQKSGGYEDAVKRIVNTKNPITATKERRAAIKKKQVRAKSISEQDEQRLLTALQAKQDSSLFHFVRVAKLTGARPAEIPGITAVPGSDSEFLIVGAKANDTGDRGLDRVITLSDSDAADLRASLAVVAKLVQKVAERQVEYEKGQSSGRPPSDAPALMQAQLRTVTKQLWPRRKCRPSLYTFRHQMGADLKVGSDRVTVAYLMGHQSTSSVDVYGNRRKARSERSIQPGRQADFTKIRINHTPADKISQAVAPVREVKRSRDNDLGF